MRDVGFWQGVRREGASVLSDGSVAWRASVQGFPLRAPGRLLPRSAKRAGMLTTSTIPCHVGQMFTTQKKEDRELRDTGDSGSR
jgi:hypothetical protein